MKSPGCMASCHRLSFPSNGNQVEKAAPIYSERDLPLYGKMAVVAGLENLPRRSRQSKDRFSAWGGNAGSNRVDSTIDSHPWEQLVPPSRNGGQIPDKRTCPTEYW